MIMLSTLSSYCKLVKGKIMLFGKIYVFQPKWRSLAKMAIIGQNGDHFTISPSPFYFFHFISQNPQITSTPISSLIL
jgi:hypothetical protein